MIQRCTNPNVPHYRVYGGRGIDVCDEWYYDFLAFYNDMGDPPTPEHSLDRIDSNGNYEPSNCRWADKQTQINNRSNTVWLTLKDVTLPMSIWATKLGINYATLRMRRSRGWSDTKLLTTPIRKLNNVIPH